MSTPRCLVITEAVCEALEGIQEPEGRFIPKLGPIARERVRAAIHRALARTAHRSQPTTSQD